LEICLEIPDFVWNFVWKFVWKFQILSGNSQIFQKIPSGSGNGAKLFRAKILPSWRENKYNHILFSIVVVLRLQKTQGPVWIWKISRRKLKNFCL